MKLQFGHGGDAVETGDERHTQTVQRRFNSATAVMPWRPREPRRNPARAGSFNSATAVMPWRRLSTVGLLHPVVGFNSATAVMPWRPLQTVRYVCEDVKLQFGHGGDAVETRRLVNQFPCVSKLQFGHGGDAVETDELHENIDPLDFGFNSATAVMPWRPVRARHGGVPVWRFNSATAVMPWRPVLASLVLNGSSSLQFGHGGDAVETPLDRVVPGG